MLKSFFLEHPSVILLTSHSPNVWGGNRGRRNVPRIHTFLQSYMAPSMSCREGTILK
jgi:hypothetical protein